MKGLQVARDAAMVAVVVGERLQRMDLEHEEIARVEAVEEELLMMRQESMARLSIQEEGEDSGMLRHIPVMREEDLEVERVILVIEGMPSTSVSGSAEMAAVVGMEVKAAAVAVGQQGGLT